MNHWRLSRACLFGSLIVVGIAACNREKLPGLAPVTGTVTMDGQPVADAQVTFDGAKTGDSAALGKTDSSGTYELYYTRGHKGSTIGEHLVHISTYSESSDDPPRIHKETIPSRYNVKSELKADVKRGANKLDFELKSGGEIIQPGDDEPKKGKGKGKKN